MLTRDELTQLLQLQATAYDLLMWLADEANRDPEVLSRPVVARLEDPDTAAEWLEEQRDRVPGHLIPAEPGGRFANLLSSFLSTSFRVRHLEFEGRLVEARVTLGAAPSDATLGLRQCQSLALQHLLAAERIHIAGKEAERLLRDQGLAEQLRLWTYAWELDRRAREKGKGSVVHQLWRSLPKDTRKTLTAEQIWQAREQLLVAVRKHCADRDA